jgi:CRISPR/Cas system-associated endonuclease Cas3-HD
LLNRKRTKLEIRKMEREIKKLKEMWFTENLGKTETDWQNEFQEDQIRHEFMSSYYNANDYLVTTAIHASIRIRMVERHVTKSTIIANINDYINNEPISLKTDRYIQCIFNDICPHKNEPMIFLAWIPARYSRSMDKDRTYIVAACETHTQKCMKNFEYFHNHIVKNVMPLRDRIIQREDNKLVKEFIIK